VKKEKEVKEVKEKKEVKDGEEMTTFLQTMFVGRGFNRDFCEFVLVGFSPWRSCDS
jgi:hypothetical protein